MGYKNRFKWLASLVKLLFRIAQSLKGLKFAKIQTHHKPLSLSELARPELRTKLTGKIEQRLQQSFTIASENRLPQDCPPNSFFANNVRTILVSSSWTRTPSQVCEACEELKNCTEFDEYPAEIQLQLSKLGWYQCVDPGRVIIREGHPANCFYFVLSGKVDVIQHNDVINTLSQGSSFGDIAIQEGSRRTASCCANGWVELFVISKSDYIELSLRQSRCSYQALKHFAFCKTISVLNCWPLDELKTVPNICRVCTYKPNEVIVKDSKKDDWIYVVMTGSCKVVKRFVDSGSKAKGMRRNISTPEGALLAASEITKKWSVPSMHLDSGSSEGQELDNMQHTSSDNANSMSLRKNYYPKQFLIQLQLLQPKDIFGLSSLIYKNEPSVTLVSNGGECVLISKSFIKRHMNEDVHSKASRVIIQLPSQEAMLKRIREHQSWNLHRRSVLRKPV